MKKIIALCFFIFCVSLLATPPKLGLSFPPVSTSDQINLTISYMKDFKAKYVRFSDNWKFRELTVGSFNFATVVTRAKTFHDSGYKVMLTMESDGPRWRCDTTQMNERGCVFNDTAVFRLYAREWLRQVSPYVDIAQFGNEWSSFYFYPGSIRNYSISSKIFCQEAASRGVPCALGGLSIGLVRAITACYGGIDHYLNDSGQYYTDLPGSPVDLSDTCATVYASTTLNSTDSVIRVTNAQYIDLHLYHDAEDWNTYIEFFQNRFAAYNKSWLISEFGGIYRFFSQEEMSRAKRTRMQLNALDRSSNIEAAMYFQLFEDTASASPFRSYLIDSNLVVSPSYRVFKNTTSQPHYYNR